MNFAVNFPINSVSFGQVSTLILRELYKRNMNPCIFPIGDTDLSVQAEDKEFFEYHTSTPITTPTHTPLQKKKKRRVLAGP